MTFPKRMCLQTMHFCKQTGGNYPDLGSKSGEIWVRLEPRTSLTCQLASRWSPFFQSSSSLGEASSIADAAHTPGFASGCHSLSWQAFTKAAARAAQGQTVVEKTPCQRMRDRQEEATQEQIWDSRGSLTAAHWPGGRPSQPPSIQRLGTTKLQGQWTMGHSHAPDIKGSRGEWKHTPCPRNMLVFVCSVF